MNIVYSLVILLFVVLIHEFGHFILAKSFGVGVTEFSVGMGPELYKVNKNGTDYYFRLLPVGGYVMLEGADGDSMEEYIDEKGKKQVRFIETDSPTSFRNVSIPRRIAVMLGGVVMNFIFALILFSVSANLVGVPTTTIGEFIEGMPAENSELEIGDKVIEVNGHKIESWNDISNSIQGESKETAKFKVLRDGKTFETEIALINEEGRYIIGIYPAYRKANFKESVKGGRETMRLYANLIFDFLGRAFHGKESIDSLSGPVGIVKTIGETAKSGAENLIFFIAYINLNLGIFNLLPIPGLDGSRILFLLLEAIRGQAVNQKVEAGILTVGVIFLIGLMIAVTYRDIVGLFK